MDVVVAEVAVVVVVEAVDAAVGEAVDVAAARVDSITPATSTTMSRNISSSTTIRSQTTRLRAN